MMNSGEHGAAAYPCIIDVKAFAEQVCGQAKIQARSDFLTARHYVELPDGPTRVGVIELDAAEGNVDSMPCNEFILVLQGGLRIGGPVDFDLRIGESAVLPKNSTFTWTAEEPAVLAFIRQESETSDRRHPLKIDPTLPREPSPPLADGLVIGEMPKAFRHVDFVTGDELFVAASWHSNAYARHAFQYEYFELMHLLEGAVSFVDRAGVTHNYGKDDVIIVRKGGAVSWDSKVTVSKIAAICRA